MSRRYGWLIGPRQGMIREFDEDALSGSASRILLSSCQGIVLQFHSSLQNPQATIDADFGFVSFESTEDFFHFRNLQKVHVLSRKRRLVYCEHIRDAQETLYKTSLHHLEVLFATRFREQHIKNL